MSGAPLSSNQTVLFGLGDLETFQTALRLISAPLMAHASRPSLRVRRAPRRRGGLYSTSKPTEGEVPPAGCAGVVCANETNNKKKTKWRAFFCCCGSRGSGGGGG